MKVYILNLLILLSVSVTIAQTGPGGVGNTSNNGLWLKANSLNLTDTDPVTTWGDVSGNANDANAAGTAIPLFVANSSMNNMPAVRLDGNNDVLTVADADILDNSSGLSYFAVIRPNNLNGSPRPILGKRIAYGSTNYAYTWFFYNSNYLNLDVNTGNNRFTTNPSSFNNNNNYLLHFNFDGSLPSASRSKIYNAGTLIKTGNESSTSIINSSADLTLGVLNAGDNRNLGADYAEVIQYNFSLNTAQTIIVHNYLSAKYNIPLTSNDFYDEDDHGDYDFEVAGIGQASDGSNHLDAQGSGIVRIQNADNLNNNEFLLWGHNNNPLNSTGVTDLPPGIESRLSRDWRASEIGEVGSIVISFDLTNVPGFILEYDLRLIIDDDGIYSTGARVLGPPTFIGAGVYEWTNININNNEYFTIGSVNASTTPLPIELTSFKVTNIKNQTVKLEWETATETNNDFFNVERSEDGKHWENIKYIKGAGNSNTPINYSFVDDKPFDGQSYYRLKQTDFDGQFTYSNINIVDIEKMNRSNIKIYPNPTQNKLHIKGISDELTQVKVFDIHGKNISSRTPINYINNTHIVVNLAALSKGIYWIKTKTTTHKIFKD